MQTKTCSRCAREQPLDQYRLRRSDDTERMPECRVCYNAAQRLRTTKRRSKDIRKTLTRIKRAKSDRDVVNLAIHLVRRYGGSIATAKMIGDEIDDLRRRRPGSPAVVHALTGMAHLIQAGGRLS